MIADVCCCCCCWWCFVVVVVVVSGRNQNTTSDAVTDAVEDLYEITARNPLFACKSPAPAESSGNAEQDPKASKTATPSVPIWELSLMSRHFHPSVRKFAEAVPTKKGVEYDGDPFEVGCVLCWNHGCFTWTTLRE